MLKYFLKRLLFAAISLLIIITIIYFLTSLLPYLPSNLQHTNPNVTDEQYNQLLAQYDLGPYGLSVVQRWWKYISGIFSGDFGVVLGTGAHNIPETFFSRIPFTLLISFVALVISIAIGLLCGTICAFYRGRAVDITLNVLATVFLSIPSFIFAILLIRAGRLINLEIQFIPPGTSNYTLSGMIRSMILPILSLTFGSAASLTYFVRNELVEIMNQDYIKTAKSKGLSIWRILTKHMLRNAGIPLVSRIAPEFLLLLSGSLIIEYFFGVQGPAQWLVSSISNGEINVVLFQTIFFTSIFFIFDLLMDCCYPLIDPRVVLVEKNNYSLYKRFVSFLKRKLWIKGWEDITEENSITLNTEDKFFDYLLENKKIINNNVHLNEKEYQDVSNNLNSNIQKKFLVIGQYKYAIKLIDEKLANTKAEGGNLNE